MENRAAVFTSSPQDVEVYRDGAWWAGSLLGWRHDSAGACQVWVRAAVRGVDETSWLPLDLLRLPEPAAQRHLSLVGAPAAQTDDAALTGTMAAIRAVPAPRARTRPGADGRIDPTATTGMPVVRDLPERRSAPAASDRPGGRRRAPEPPTVEHGAVVTAAGSASAGRHRAAAPTSATAAASAGRHRAVDTGVLPVVRDDAPAPLTELPRRRTPVPRADEPDSHLLTRPMRLTDAVAGRIPQPRRGSVSGRLTGV
jgi:hypothetical protein